MLNWRLVALSSLGFAIGIVMERNWHPAKTQADRQVDRIESPPEEGRGSRGSEDPFGRFFLLEKEWSDLLASKSAEEILGLIRERPATFWKGHPLGPAAAYRLFGALARLRPGEAFDNALEWSGGDSMPADARGLCMYWAFVGVFENDPGLRIEDSFAKTPKDSWPTLVEAAIGGTDSASISADMYGIGHAITSLAEAGKVEKDKKELDNLLRKVIQTWIRRDPSAVLNWLQTKDGGPYRNMMPKVLAELSLGNPAVLAELASGAKPVPIPELAKACYEGEWDIARLRALLINLPEPSRREFLNEYAARLATGSPHDVLSFINQAEPGFFTPGVAKVLAPKVLLYSPELFDKLGGNLKSEARDKLLDETFEEHAGGRVDPTALSKYYLNKRGVSSPNGSGALGRIAFRDLKEALDYVAAAPKEQQATLIADVYRAGASKLTETGASMEEVLAFLENAPAGAVTSVAELAVGSIAGKDPRAALEILGRFSKTDDRMWAVFFEQAELSADELNDLLGKALRNAVDPSVYSAAASRITDLSAREDLESAQQTVELLTDPAAKETCTATLLKRWGQVDPLGAIDYVDQLPAGSRRDAALRALLPHLSFAPDRYQQLLSLASSTAVREAIVAEAEKKSAKLR